jgi:hypothetical protein
MNRHLLLYCNICTYGIFFVLHFNAENTNILLAMNTNKESCFVKKSDAYPPLSSLSLSLSITIHSLYYHLDLIEYI